MIFDRIEQHHTYQFSPLWQQAFDILKTLTPETACGRHEIQGDDLFLIVDQYETKPRSAAKLETHCQYIDIQFLISGRETHEVFPKDELTESEPYNPEKDAAFYQIPENARARIHLNPGDFAVYFPHDAHMPCLATDNNPQPVKKAVVKLRIN